MRIFQTIIIMLTCFVATIQAGLRINEVTPINTETIDDENEFPDSWIELYNESEEKVSLKDYQIVLSTEDVPYTIKKDLIVEAHSFALFYCDGKQYVPHIPFKIPYNKHFTITLLTPEKEVADRIEVPTSPKTGISFGTDSSDTSVDGWLSKPTAGKKNEKVKDKILPPPQLTLDNPYFEQNIVLNITLPETHDTNYVIRYTTDGSNPTEQSPIAPAKLEFTETTVLKASTFAEDAINSEVTTQTVIKLGREVTLPILSISTDKKFLYDDSLGIYTDGKYSGTNKNYEFDWHRPVNIEYFDTTGKQRINQLGEIRIAGATSRKHPMKSLILYAKKRLGKEYFSYPFWAEKPQIKESPSILLRNAGNDFLFAHIRDAACQTFYGKYVENIDWQAYQPAILLINGEYFGLTNIRERSNIDFIETNYQIKKADVIENWFKVNSGNINNYLSFVDLFSRENVSYDELAEKMEIEEFINLLILEAYFGNVDFPDNNIVMWREQKEEARWRWIAKDLDMGWHYRFDRNPDVGFFNMNFFEINLAIDSTSSSWEDLEYSTRLMRKLAKKEEFKNEFIDRFTVYMGDFLNQKYIVETLDSLAKNIEYEFPFTFEKYADYRVNDHADWHEELEIMRNFPPDRNILNMYALKEFYQLGDIFPLIIEKGKFNNSELVVNDIRLKTERYNGHYFKNRELRLTLEDVVEDSLTFEGWRVIYQKQEVSDTIYYETSKALFSLNFEDLDNIECVYIAATDSIPPPIIKEPILYSNSEGITIKNLIEGEKIYIYDLTGRLIKEEIANDSEVEFSTTHKGVMLIKLREKWYKLIR